MGQDYREYYGTGKLHQCQLSMPNAREKKGKLPLIPPEGEKQFLILPGDCKVHSQRRMFIPGSPQHQEVTGLTSSTHAKAKNQNFTLVSSISLMISDVNAFFTFLKHFVLH